MERNELITILRERIREFGDRPAYIIYPDEMAAGIQHAILSAEQPEDRGDGTIATKATFEGNQFLCFTEKKG